MVFQRLDIIGAIRNEDNYEKCRNYWKYLKAKLKKENSELVSATTQLKKRALILQQFLDKCREKFWNISKIS